LTEVKDHPEVDLLRDERRWFRVRIDRAHLMTIAHGVWMMWRRYVLPSEYSNIRYSKAQSWIIFQS